MNKYKILKGGIHIHSKFSDGSGTIEEIVAEAQRANLDFIIISDHHNHESKKFEGRYGNLNLIGAYEWDDSKKNHSLMFNSEIIYPQNWSIQKLLDTVNQKKESLFMAHPSDKYKPFWGKDPYPWNYWENHPGINGIEIWNFFSEWREKVNEKNYLETIQNPSQFLTGPHQETIDFWDKVNLERAFPAIGGLDAHAFNRKVMDQDFVILPYYESFCAVQTHVFLPEEIENNFESYKAAILNAIMKGNSFIINQAIADIGNLHFSCTSDNESYMPGSKIELKENPVLKIDTGIKASVDIFRNGSKIESSLDFQMKLSIKESGNYRFQIFVEGKPWVFSNNYYVVED